MTRHATPLTTASLLCLALLAAATIPRSAPAAPPDHDRFVGLTARGGVGLPELMHAELGYFLTPRLELEAQYKYIGANHLTGVGATGYFFNETFRYRPPRHAILGSVSLAANPTLDEFRITRDEETIGAAAGLYFGYGFVSRDLLTIRVLGGTLLFDHDGLGYAPSLRMSAGLAF
jgi:hypothetical protein